MDQIKLLVKDVLHKIQDIPDVPFTPSIRMSEISTESSFFKNTSRSTSEQSMSNKTDLSNVDISDENDTVLTIFSKMTSESSWSTNTSSSNSDKSMSNKTDITYADIHNNNNDINEEMLSNDKKCNNETPLTTTETSRPEAIEFKKVSLIAKEFESTYITDRGSHDSLSSISNGSTTSSRRGRPKMGIGALMRSQSGETHDDPAAIVHDLVHDKFKDQIEPCIDRMYHRRVSRDSRGTDDDGTGSNYSDSNFSLRTRTPDISNTYFSMYYPDNQHDFLKSTDDLNKDTTVELFNSTTNSVDGNLSTDMDYCPKKFLKTALGDLSCYESQLTDLKIQLQDVSLKNSRLRHSQSVDPIGKPTLLSRAGSFCNFVRKSVRRGSFRERNFDDIAEAKKRNRNRDRCQSFSPDYSGPSANLMQELYVQNGVIFQVSKALSYCRNNKDITSPEYIEAEKILLVALRHKEAIATALDAKEYDETEEYNQRCSGTLDISNVVYHPSPMEQDDAKYVKYFVIVVTSGKTVLSSKVLVPNINGEIVSNKNFQFKELQTDFDVTLSCYSMTVKPGHRYQGEDSKQHKKDHSFARSILHLNHHKTSRRSLFVDDISSIKPSSFTLEGICIIRCSDLEETQFRTHPIIPGAPCDGYFDATLTGNVQLTNRTCGFLTIGFEDKGHLIWNRRWCVLEGQLLKYWNYPSEQFSCDPVGVMNLGDAAEKTSPADRAICPRPKTLCLLIKNRDNDLVSKYFLSFDCVDERNEWQDDINFVIGTLSSWKRLGDPPSEEVSSL